MTEAQMTFILELKRMEMQQESKHMEMQERQRQQDREMKMARMKIEFDLKALGLNRPIPQPNTDSQQPTFKVKIASKLLRKLGSDHALEVYLITFQKIAKLNNRPKEYWPAILQTQLKGKALRIFAELPDATIKDFDRLQAALLAAYELNPEH